MFQNLRANSQLYVLHKEAKHYIETASVVSVSTPRAKYPVAQPFASPQVEMVVDVVASINGQNTTFQNLPAGGDIADFGQNGNIVISCSRDAMNNEISMIKQKRLERVNSRDYDLSVIASCDEMLTMINPEFAEKQRQENEINTLKGQMAEMSKNMSDLMELNKRLMEQLGVVETSKTKK
jgi:hypothetical protein|nr:MAG TPA: hypothetical protein [Bacteriophage sp.]